MRSTHASLLTGVLFSLLLPMLSLAREDAPRPMANGSIGKRETVCAVDLYVRTDPGTGAWMGTLYKGQTFLVERRSGNSVYGFAYGDLNRRGWVTDGYFC